LILKNQEIGQEIRARFQKFLVSTHGEGKSGLKEEEKEKELESNTAANSGNSSESESFNGILKPLQNEDYKMGESEKIGGSNKRWLMGNSMKEEMKDIDDEAEINFEIEIEVI
jgi:hypothetical protein